MPTNIAATDTSQRLPTRVGIENEANGIKPREMAAYLAGALPASSAPTTEEEQDLFEGDLHHLQDGDGNVWKAKHDNSCDAEMNTPPLATMAQLKRAKRVIAGLKHARFPARTPYERTRVPNFDATTGLHLHFEMENLQPAQVVHWLALMHRHQPFIYRAFHVATPRLRYCAPLDSAIMGSLIDSPPDSRHALSSAFGDTRDDRDTFINLQNMAPGRIGTSEIRCFNATAEGYLIALYVGLGMRAYQIAARHTGPTPQAWRTPIDDPHAFAVDFGLDASHSLLQGILAEAARPLSWYEQVMNDPDCFKHLPDVARDDFLTARLAVSFDGNNLAYVGPNRALDSEIVWTACIQSGESMRLAHPFFQQNRDFVLNLMGKAADILPHVHPMLRDDFDVVHRGFTEGTHRVLEDAGPGLLSNFLAMQYFVGEFSGAVQFAQLPFHEAFALAHGALSIDAANIRFLPPELRSNAPALVELIRLVPEAQYELSAHQCELLGLAHPESIGV